MKTEISHSLEQEFIDLDRAVDLFGVLMKERLHIKALGGYHGWNNPKFKDVVRYKFLDHAARLFTGDTSQAVDVANLAMMLFKMEVSNVC